METLLQIKKREYRHIKERENADKLTLAKLGHVIKRSSDRLSLFIEAWGYKYAKGNQVLKTEALKLADGTDVKRLISLAEEVSEGLDEDLPEIGEGIQVNRLTLLETMAGLEILKLLSDGKKIIAEHVDEAAKTEVDRQATILGASKLEHFDTTQIKQILEGADFGGYLDKYGEAFKADVRLQMKKSLIEGKHPRKWAKDLAQHFEQDYKTLKFAMERIAVTETTRAQTEAQRIIYENLGVSQFIMICEPTACGDCLVFDEVVRPITDLRGADVPPLHPFCRCSTCAHVEPE